MTDHNHTRSSPQCGQTVLTLPGAGGTGHYDELLYDDVPTPDTRIWLGSVGVLPLPRDCPKLATLLRRHKCEQAAVADVPQKMAM